MNLHFYRRVVAFLLGISLLLLPSCSDNSADDNEEQESAPEETALEEISISDGAFGIGYISSEGLNPYSISSSTNLSVAGLIYEGLFSVNDCFEALAVLCESYTADNTYTQYTFTIRSDIKFSDGESLTANDVIYSLECAKDSDLYSERMSIIKDVSAIINEGVGEDDEDNEDPYSFTITLNKAYGNLPVLLNVPIIKSGSNNQSHPVGTGPYEYSESGSRLTANSNYWGESVPIAEILLTQTENTTEAFESGVLDAVNLDTTSNNITLSGALDTRKYSTSIIEYIGFNTSRITDVNIRLAISSAINREDIIQTCLSSAVTESSLPIHPSVSYYNSTLAKQYSFSIDTAAEILAQIDEIGFSYYDYQNGNDQETWLTLNMLVCNETTSRFESAKLVAQGLQKLGIEVNVVSKGYEEYVKALKGGNFDMYYGQARLKNDFDLSALLTRSGSLNYGNVSSEDYSTLINAFLAADNNTKAMASDEMCKYILENAPICVIGFKQMTVITRQGAIKGMNPCQDNIFYEIANFELNV